VEGWKIVKKVVVRVNDLLHKYNMSISELHIRTGIRRAALSELANGKRERIQFEHIEKIANTLSIEDIRDIITLVEVPGDFEELEN